MEKVCANINTSCYWHFEVCQPQGSNKNQKRQQHQFYWHWWIGTGKRTRKKNNALPPSFWRTPFLWEENLILPGAVVQFAANPADLPPLEGRPAVKTDETFVQALSYQNRHTSPKHKFPATHMPTVSELKWWQPFKNVNILCLDLGSLLSCCRYSRWLWVYIQRLQMLHFSHPFLK